MNFFGKSKKKTAASNGGGQDPTASIVKLRETIADQEKREAHIQKKVDGMVAEAKGKMAAGDKKGALFAMKRKKMYEAEIEKIQNTKMTIETQVMNLESATTNIQTYKAMQHGTGAMKKIRTDVDIDKVDNMMDDIKEEMDLQNEISNAIGQPVDPMMYGDDEDLLNELAELEGADAESELLKPTPDLSLPSVPNKKLPSKKKQEMEEEAALKQLERELAGM